MALTVDRKDRLNRMVKAVLLAPGGVDILDLEISTPERILPGQEPEEGRHEAGFPGSVRAVDVQ